MRLANKRTLVGILILAACVCAYTAQARMVMVVVGQGAAAAAALCSSCTPGDPSDVFCEDFGGSTECVTGSAASDNFCRCAWTLGDGWNGSVTFAAGSVTIATTTNADNYQSITRSLSGTAIYAKFKLTINSTTLATGESNSIVSVDQSPSSILKIRNTSGSYYADLVGVGTVTGTTALNGTDDVIELYINEAGETMQLWVNGTSQGTAASNYNVLTAINFYQYNSVKTMSVTFKDIQVDNTARP